MPRKFLGGTPTVDTTALVKTDDSRLSDARTPTGSAGGDLTGTYPNPTLAATGTAGTYTKVTTDSKGRVTSGTSATASDVGAVPTSRTLTGTAPITVGGVSASAVDLSADRTIAVTAATTSAAGVVQLSDSTSTTSSTLAATSTAVKAAKDAADAAQTTANAAVPKTTTLTASDPLTIGGSSQALDLSANRTIAVKAATTAGQTGVVALTDSTSSTSTTTAATPNSVKTAYDLANGAIAKSVVTTVGDLIIGAGSPAVPTRLAIGANTYVLTSNGTTATWAAAPAEPITTLIKWGLV